MSRSRTESLLDHEYDGIREYDNPTPGWWHLIFFGTVLFSAVYGLFWEFSPLATSIQAAWEQRQVEEYKRVFGAIGNLEPDERTILTMAENPQMLAIAKGIFVGNCAACHASDGGGINGPNLTDDAYKNVTNLPGLFAVITKGANNGAMPAWENRLGKNERVIVAAFVATLRGTRPANSKAPEGIPIDPWPSGSGVLSSTK